MPWINREGTSPDQRLKDIQESFSIENLVENPIHSEFPSVDEIKEGRLVLVKNGGTLYLVSKEGSTRQRVAFTAF